MYSNKHEYYITLMKNEEYISGSMRNRCTCALENHHRGMDLSDGKHDIETMSIILGAIISYELKEIEINEDCYHNSITKHDNNAKK